MSARPRPPSGDRPSNNLGRINDEPIRAYLGVNDDGEIARLAAMMSPKNEVFDAGAQIAQTVALQAEATAELIRRRETIASSMSHDTLLELARQLETGDVRFLHMMDDDSFTDPVSGPVLRRLASLMRAMPPPQDFQEHFLAEDPTAALDLAASRTVLPRPLPAATFEEALRYATNIPSEQISWDILNGAFIDFLRIWCLHPTVPADLFPEDTGAGLTMAEVSQVLANLEQHQQERASFLDKFTPGQDFRPDIDEIAHRIYAECWEGGLLGHLWRRRLAWLVIEFTPFWQKHGESYRSIHTALTKTAEDARKKKSAKATKSGEAGRQGRESKRWKTITADFIKFLGASSKEPTSSTLNDLVADYVEGNPSFGGQQKQTNTMEFLRTLCTAVTAGKDAREVLGTLQRSGLAKIEALEPELREQKFAKLMPNQRKQYESKGTTPPAWVQYKSLTKEAVRACLNDLKHTLSTPRVKKDKN